jgi:glycine oxidase
MPAQGWWLGPPVRRTGLVPDPTQENDRGDSQGVVVNLPKRGGAGTALDAVIVGGGVIGLACAWSAARRGLRVRVLERDEPGAGASGIAAGMLAPVGEATFGEEGLLKMALASASAWPGFASELEADGDDDPGYAPLGALHVALDRDESEELRRRHELMKSLGLEAEWLRPTECRALEPGLSPSCTAGVSAAGDAAVDPRLLIRCLVRATEACGGEIVTGADVVAAQIAADRVVGVRTADGTEHRAEHVVLASGAWSGTAGWLPAPARPPVRPVKGQILTLQGPAHQPVCERIVASERVYLVPRPDGHLVVGATVEERGFDTQVTAGGVHELLREAYRALPDIAELELVDAIAGLRPGTPDNLPVVGRGALEGLLLATGHWRNGILLAPITGEAIAALLAGAELPQEIAVADPARLEGVEGRGILAPLSGDTS